MWPKKSSSVHQGIQNMTNDEQTYKTGCVFVFFLLLCLKALFSTNTVVTCSHYLSFSSLLSSALLWFSCHYLLIKVENNSPGPGHLFNDKPHSSVRLPAGLWFGYSGHHAFTTPHFILWSYIALINASSGGKPLHLLFVHVWVYLRGFLLPSPLQVIGYALRLCLHLLSGDGVKEKNSHKSVSMSS